jgi:hypothetical protein
MQFAIAASMAGLAAVAVAVEVPAKYAQANSTMPSYTTEVVKSYTTYCPESTTLTYGHTTLTITSATTLTVTECPGGCTVTKPVTS